MVWKNPLFHDGGHVMVYGVFGGCYSNWYVVGYFDDREEANKYCCAHGSADFYVKPIKSLNGKEDLSWISLKYIHEIVFDLKDKNWVMREEPDRYKCYIADELQCNDIRSNLTYKWICFSINIDHNDRKLAEKIAQDYLAELCSYGEGIVYQKNIKLMNERFFEPFKEKEKLKRKAELERKERAELARLKEKYEK